MTKSTTFLCISINKTTSHSFNCMPYLPMIVFKTGYQQGYSEFLVQCTVLCFPKYIPGSKQYISMIQFILIKSQKVMFHSKSSFTYGVQIQLHISPTCFFVILQNHNKLYSKNTSVSYPCLKLTLNVDLQ